MGEYLASAQGQAVGGLGLAFGGGVNASADDFSGVGAQVDHHGQDGSRFGRQPHARRRQPKKHKKQLHDEGRIADQLDIRAHAPFECRATIRARPGEGYAQRHTHHGRHHRQPDCPGHTLGQQRPLGQHGQKIKLDQHLACLGKLALFHFQIIRAVGVLTKTVLWHG